MINNYKQRQQWFKDRIGTRVFRGKVSCECKSCTCIEKIGLIITDLDHAIYLNDISSELGIEYRDVQ